MDIKGLLEEIGNALFQRCLVWEYEIRVGDSGGGCRWGLHMVLADVDATALVISATEDRNTNVATFGCVPNPPVLSDICARVQVALGSTADERTVDDPASISPARAIELLIEAIGGGIATLDARSSAAPTIRLTNIALDADVMEPDYEA